MNKRRRVLRAILLGVQVTSVDTAAVTNSIDKRQRGGSLGGRTRQGVADPSQRRGVARVHARDEEHHGDVARGGRVRGGAEDEGRHGYAEGHDDVEVALARAVGVPGVDAGRDDAEDVGRAG